MNKKIIIIIAIVVLLAGGGVAAFLLLNNGSASKYKEAEGLMQTGQYDEAKNIYVDLGDYEDSANKIKECDYQKAKALLEKGETDAAKEVFTTISGYSDSDTMVKECDYQKAIKLYEDSNYREAVIMFADMYDYSDSKDYVYRIAYNITGTDIATEIQEGLTQYNSYISEQINGWLSYYKKGRIDYVCTEDGSYPKLVEIKKTSQDRYNVFKEIFSNDVLNKMNDENLNKIKNAFEKYINIINDMYDSTTVFGYILSTVGGDSDSVSKELDNLSTSIEELANALKVLANVAD